MLKNCSKPHQVPWIFTPYPTFFYDVNVNLFYQCQFFRYQGHCPTTKYDYGETYGEATSKYFQDYRSRVLSASADPYCRGGDFPTYYTHRPETVISNRTRTRDRWLLAPKYSLTNIDFDRKEELKQFDKVFNCLLYILLKDLNIVFINLKGHLNS